MKVFELAKELGKNSKELAKELGVKSHFSIVPEDKLDDYVEAEVEEVAPKANPIKKVVNEVKKKVDTATCPVDLETLATSLRGCGAKSPYWKYRDLLNG